MLTLKPTIIDQNNFEFSKSTVSLAEVKSYQYNKKVIDEYQSFISTLSLQEINNEVEYLLSEIDLVKLNKEVFIKLDSIMQILEKRSSKEAATLIRKIREEVYHQIQDIY